MKKEAYKTIPNFEEYTISNFGNIISYKKYNNTRGFKKLKPVQQQDGYFHFTLSKNKIKYQFVAHRLVAITFISNPDNKPCVNHKNANRTDNRVENLEWCTHLENSQHASGLGLFRSPKYYLGKTGKLHPNSKKLKVTLHDGTYVGTFYGTAEAGRELGVSQVHVSNCAIGKKRHTKYKFKYI